MAGRSPRDPADPYRVLGVPADASRADIVRAYRRLARGAHPDTGSGDSAGEGRFDEITRAYQVLADPDRRARYDRAHTQRDRAPRPGRRAQPGSSAGPVRGAQPVRGAWSVAGQPQIWAGPVHVEPPAGRSPAGESPAGRSPAGRFPAGSAPAWDGLEEEPAAAIGGLLLRYLHETGGWSW